MGLILAQFWHNFGTKTATLSSFPQKSNLIVKSRGFSAILKLYYPWIFVLASALEVYLYSHWKSHMYHFLCSFHILSKISFWIKVMSLISESFDFGWFEFIWVFKKCFLENVFFALFTLIRLLIQMYFIDMIF